MIIKRKKWILLHLVLILFTAAVTFLLPNLDAFHNRREDLVSFSVTGEEINKVFINTLDDRSNVYGFYMKCGGTFVHDMILKTRADVSIGKIRIYYIDAEGEEYSEEKSQDAVLSHNVEGYHVSFDREAYALRLDLQEITNADLSLLEVDFNNRETVILWQNALPYLFFLAAMLLTGRRRRVFRDTFAERKLVLTLAKNDLKARYAGSAFGPVWAYVQPLLTIIVMWYVFQIGFRNPPVRHVAFIVWFVVGYVPWMYFNDGILGITGSICDYSYLVKKIRFRVSVLPAIKLLSGLFVHGFFLVFAVVIVLLYGYRPEWIWLQVFYYSFCLMSLIYALGLIFCSLTVLFRDFSQVVAVMLQILFWYTPIFWSYESLQESVVGIFTVNPLFYIVNGYRDTFINHVWFWQNPGRTALFWGFAMGFLVLGLFIFHRARPHFSDLL